MSWHPDASQVYVPRETVKEMLTLSDYALGTLIAEGKLWERGRLHGSIKSLYRLSDVLALRKNGGKA